MTEAPNIWMETYSGHRANPLTLTGDQVVMDDIIVSLGRQRRFLGHTFIAYSVLEHSVLVERVLRHRGANARTRLGGLLHDAKETYIGDIPTPVKRHFKTVPGWQDLWERMEDQVDMAISQHMGMPWLQAEMVSPMVVAADIDVLALEAQVMMKSRGVGWTFSQKPERIPAEAIEEHGMLGHWGYQSIKRVFEDTLDRLVEEVRP